MTEANPGTIPAITKQTAYIRHDDGFCSARPAGADLPHITFLYRKAPSLAHGEERGMGWAQSGFRGWSRAVCRDNPRILDLKNSESDTSNGRPRANPLCRSLEPKLVLPDFFIHRPTITVAGGSAFWTCA